MVFDKIGRYPPDFVHGIRYNKELGTGLHVYYILDGASFAGSRYAVIHTNGVISYNNCNFKDAIIYQEQPIHRDLIGVKFKGALAIRSEFDRRINRTSKILIDPEGCTFTDCDFDGVAFVDDPEKGKFINCNLDNIEVLKHYNGERTKKEIVFYTLDGKEVNTSSITENYIRKADGDNSIEEKASLDEKEIIVEAIKLKEKEKEIEEAIQSVEDALDKYNKSVEKLEQLKQENTKNLGRLNISRDELLIKVDDHYEIKPEIVEKGLLKYYNLSSIDFTNVKVGGYNVPLDFRKTGARLKPQEVYNKDLSYCILDKENVKFYDNFECVNIEGINDDDCDFNIKDILEENQCDKKSKVNHI